MNWYSRSRYQLPGSARTFTRRAEEADDPATRSPPNHGETARTADHRLDGQTAAQSTIWAEFPRARVAVTAPRAPRPRMGHKPREVTATSGHSRALTPVDRQEHRSWQASSRTTDLPSW